MCCGAVDANDSTAGFAFDDIGRETFSVSNVVDVDAFVLNHVCCIEQIGVDCYASDVVEIGFGDGNSVYFRF